MKKIKGIIVVSLLLITLVRCESTQETYSNGVPTYFLEPDGYIIAKVVVDENWLTRTGAYGYIKDEDYQAYIDGNLTGSLIVKHPYEEGKEIAISIDDIDYINIGIYENLK